ERKKNSEKFSKIQGKIQKEGTPFLSCSKEGSLTYPTFLPSRAVAVAASYVVVPFLPLLCNVRRPRAGYGRPDVTVSGAPAKVVAVFS
ncbi:hypothetical protein L249_7421, partial [Ophiocordyceps polyrhachis-furcata BCC 54312]